MITNQLNDLHASVNDIYTQYDEGDIDYNEAQQILMRVCKHFIAPQPQSGPRLEHEIFFEKASDCYLWLDENEIDVPTTLTLHLGE